MKNDPPNHDLLNDFLEDTAGPSFRAGALDRMLGEARRLRRQRQLRRRLLAVACAVAAAVVAWNFLPPAKDRMPAKAESLVIHSRPLDRAMIVGTESGSVSVINSADMSMAVVKTLPAAELFESIGDDKLFALLEGKPVALVRRGPGDVELVFLNPADRDAFDTQSGSGANN